MPSRESVSEAVRARTEFATAVRTGIDALMGRCGYSRERAVLSLLKEINRGHGPDSKPTDDEIFDAMRRHKLGLDEANRAIVVSRAMRRELLFLQQQDNDNKNDIGVLEAIQRLTSKISLDNILYESGEDNSDDDDNGQNEIKPLNIPKFSRVSSSSSMKNLSSSTTTTTNSTTTNNTTNSRKRNKKNTSPSPRKQLKINHGRNKVNNSNNINNNNNSSSTIHVGRKRSIEDLDSTMQNVDVGTKAATGRPQLRASKRLHRSSNSTESSVSSGLNASK